MLVTIEGLPGLFKSTLAKNVSEKLFMPYINLESFSFEKVCDPMSLFPKNKDAVVELTGEGEFLPTCDKLSVFVKHYGEPNECSVKFHNYLVIDAAHTSIQAATDAVINEYYRKLSADIPANSIKIHSVRMHQNTLFCDLALPQCFWVYFNTMPWLSYTFSFDVTDLPYDIAIMPFVLVIAPIVWSTGLVLHLERFDAVLYKSLQDIKGLFVKKYNKDLTGSIVSDDLCIYHRPSSDDFIMFYSGGVDATYNLFENQNKVRDVLVMKGFDRPLEEMQKNKSESFFKHIIPIKNKSLSFVGSPNLHNINYTKLNEDFRPSATNMNYWCCYAVGLYTFAHAIVLAYLRNIYNVILSSSYKHEDNIMYGASKVVMDLLRTSFCQMVILGDNCSRMDKLRIIIQENEGNSIVKLRVCKRGGIPDNCCKCEKCSRTILGLYLLGEDPCDYGFYTDIHVCLAWLRNHITEFSFHCVDDWLELIDYIRNSQILSNDANVNWLLKLDIKNIALFNKTKSIYENKKINW